MNNKLLLLAVSLSLATYAASQTVYNLYPYTKDNRIDLTIANESQTVPAERIEVRAIEYLQEITFKNVIQTVESVPPEGDRTVSFNFDVGYPSRVVNNSTDTIKFLISDGSGATWEKSIVVSFALPSTFALEQNFPNPFNPLTTIRYQLPVDSKVTVKVYDVLGREVVTLVDEVKSAGYYEAVFNATQFSSGVYFYRMVARSLSGGQAGNYYAVRKLLMMK